MSITHKQGDLVKALKTNQITRLLHITNCQGVMGAGLAKQVKATFPDAFCIYKRELRLGNISANSGVVNMNAQLNYGTGTRQLNYGALGECLARTKSFLHKVGHEGGIGIPYLMGCGLAGGDWEIVLEMVKHYLAEWDVIVYTL
jgi:hypothetical protein